MNGTMPQNRPLAITASISLLLALVLTPLMNAADTKTSDQSAKPSRELATFGGGCFWCTEAYFETLKGVDGAVSGYAGGPTPNPTYEAVCSGTTGHAEVIQVSYDPAVITYEQLLDFFWKAHNPTTLNQQGADVGTQYRSIILYHNEAQKAAAEKAIKTAEALFRDPIVTQVVPLTKFYPAEAYHQDYFRLNPEKGYCKVVIAPKLEKLKKSK